MMLILYGLLTVSGLLSLVLGGRLYKMIRRFTRHTTISSSSELEELPTVSVCIPARNETHAMTQCLERVVASMYPKLEIIVLDDESKDNTSVLIKSFAHSGVRFVEGTKLPDGWLGKTYAEHELYSEASGELLLFMDVDTHITPTTIDKLVAIMTKENAEMVSVLPTRDDIWRASVLFATLRYFWTIVLHRKTMPAVASSAWMVRRSLLRDRFDGLITLRSAVEPERLVATYAAESGQYRFLISTDDVGVSYEKKWHSQLETSVRLLYPAFRGQITQVILAYIGIILGLLPFAWVPSALITGWHLSHIVAMIIAFLLIADYTLYTTRVWRKGWLIGGLIFPFVLLQEVCLLTLSIYAYATHKVTWKGRPISGSAKSVTHPATD